MIRKSIIFLLILFSCFNLFSAVELGTVDTFVISSSKTQEDSNAQVNVITKQDIDNLHPESIFQVVNTLPSASFASYGALGSLQNVIIRGTGASRTQILLNDTNLTSAYDGTFNISEIPLSSIERIEIISSGTGKYGRHVASGGLVNIITKQAEDKQKLTLDFENGSFLPIEGSVLALLDSQKTDITYSKAINNQNILFSVGGQRASNNYSYKDGDSWVVRENASMFSVNSLLNINGKFDTVSYSTNNIFNYQHAQLPGSILYASSKDSQNNIFVSTINKVQLKQTGILLSYNYNPLFYYSPMYGNDRHHKHNFDVKLDTAVNISDSVVLYPYADLSFVTVKSTSFDKEFINRFFPKTGLSSSIALGNAIIYPFAEIGYSTDIKSFIPNASIGAEFSPFKNWTTGTNISFANNLPTFNDMYYPLYWGYRGNPNLKPEKVLSVELSLKFDNKSFAYCGSVFTKWFHDMIVTYYDSVQTSTKINLDDALFLGTEQSVSYTKNGFSAKLGWLLNKSYDLSGSYRISDQKSVAYARLHTLTFSLLYTIKSVTFSTDGKYMGSYEDSFATKCDGCFIWNLGVSCKTSEKTDFYLKIDNILNTQYQLSQGYPMPGVKIRLGGKISLL